MLLAVSLGGCASMSEKMSHTVGSLPGIGLPANAPERPAEAHAFPAVHDMPPQRTTAVLTADEQRAIEKELVSARNNQTGAAPAQAASAPAPAKPAAKRAVATRAKPAPAPDPAAYAPAPPPSSRMIY
jgi:hypothetical protein